MKDGLVLMYVQNDVIYPVAMSESQLQMLQVLGEAIFEGKPVKVIDRPLGKAINLLEKKG